METVEIKQRFPTFFADFEALPELEADEVPLVMPAPPPPPPPTPPPPPPADVGVVEGREVSGTGWRVGVRMVALTPLDMF